MTTKTATHVRVAIRIVKHALKTSVPALLAIRVTFYCAIYVSRNVPTFTLATRLVDFVNLVTNGANRARMVHNAKNATLGSFSKANAFLNVQMDTMKINRANSVPSV